MAFILAALVYTETIQIWMILTLSFISGCAQAFGGPAYQSLIPTLVGKEHLPNAVALNSIQFNLARVIGPIVAGAALAAFGMVACFGLNGISFLFVIAAILALRDIHVPPAATTNMLEQMKDGLRYVRNSRNLMIVTALGFTGAFLGLPLLTFLPVITKDVFHQDVGFYSRLMTCSGAGAVTGALIVAWIGKHRHIGRMLLVFLALFGTAMAAFSLSRTPILSAVILFLAGVAAGDVLLAHHLAGATARPTGAARPRRQHLHGGVSRRLTARRPRRRLAGDASRIRAGGVDGEWHCARLYRCVLLDPGSRAEGHLMLALTGRHFLTGTTLLACPPKRKREDGSGRHFLTV